MGSGTRLSAAGVTSSGAGLLGGQPEVVHHVSLPHRRRRASPLPDGLHPDVADVLAGGGIADLHAFQAEAVEQVLCGRHVVLVGGTGSGKSLCYQVPILEHLHASRSATALYVAPTKALAQDQARRLRDLGARWARPMLYDGDTPTSTRATVRRSANLLLTNPDMLSAGILPRHGDWARLLGGLRVIVIDESHVYRGVFGSHVAMVMRRLLRLCAHHGASPVVVASSGTIANPAEHMAALAGIDAVVVGDDGAPSAGRDILIWNPLVDEEGVRASALTDASRIFAQLVAGGVPTIAFTRTRSACELVYRFACERLEQEGHEDVARLLAPYRGGYAPEERRAVERALARGELLGVVATNALEVGIDIGSLEASLCTTFPGSITSLLQQWGRAGRGEERGLGVLVAGPDALDQYFAREPERLLARPVEHAVVSTSNPRIVVPHVAAAACELAIGASDRERFGSEAIDTAIAILDEQGRLRRSDDGFHYVGRDHPAGSISLRAVDGGRITIVDATTGSVLGDLEQVRALTTLFPGAVYLHRGHTWLVSTLDLGRRVAAVEPFDDPWYTMPDTDTSIEVLDVRAVRDAGAVRVHWGLVEVEEQLVGYQRTSTRTHAPLEHVEQHLPPTRFITEAVWYAPVPASLEQLGTIRMLGSIHAAEHAAIGMLPLFATCDRADIGGLSIDWHEHLGQPTIFVYDGHPGGVGITEVGFERFEEWIEATIESIDVCRCAEPDGCPSCVQSPKCGNLNDPLDREGALVVLRAALGSAVKRGRRRR